MRRTPKCVVCLPDVKGDGTRSARVVAVHGLDNLTLDHCEMQLRTSRPVNGYLKSYYQRPTFELLALVTIALLLVAISTSDYRPAARGSKPTVAYLCVGLSAFEFLLLAYQIVTKVFKVDLT